MDDVFYGEAFAFVEPIVDGVLLGETLTFLEKIELLFEFEEQQPLSDQCLPTHIAPIYEEQPLVDDAFWHLTVLDYEQQPSSDNWLMSLVQQMEVPQPLADDLHPTVVYRFEEDQPVTDTMSWALTQVMEERQPVGDEVKPGLIVAFEEQQKSGDDVNLFILFDYQTTAKSQILQLIDTHDAFESVILPFSPPVTNVLTDPLNTFEPITVIDGVVYAGTPPPGVTDLIQWNPQAISGGQCDLASYSIGLGFGGGSWEVTGPTVGFTLGSAAIVAGLSGVCTDFGLTTGNSGKYHIASGIFGSRNMSKQMLLVLDQSQLSNVRSLVPNIYLNAPTTTNWSTVATAAKALANKCQVTLTWATHDAPLTDMFAETGMTIIDALQSLASKVNGFVCWDGAQGYVVIDPVTGFGGWSPPPCELIAAGGASYRNHLDLRRDVVLVQVKQSTKGGISFNSHPLAKPLYEQVETITSISKPDEKKTYYIELPGDFKRVNPNNPLAPSGRIQVIPGQKDDDSYKTVTHSAVTTDNTVWFNASFPIVQDTKTGKFKYRIERDQFPPEDGGDYTFNVGYVRELDGIRASYNDVTGALFEKERSRRSAENERIKYIKTGSATINCLFYGSVPLPGQRTSISYDGVNFQGIVESVNISNGQMSVTLGRYIKTNLMTARSILDYYYATGQQQA